MAANGSAPCGSGINRRQLLTGAGAAAGGLAVGVADSAAQDESGAGETSSVEDGSTAATVVGGTIKSITGPSSLELAPAPPPPGEALPPQLANVETLAVELQDGARLRRDKPALLDDFIVGDEVGVGGEFSATGAFLASSMDSIYHVVDAEVTDRDGGTLETDDGELVLQSDSRPIAGESSSGVDVEAEPLSEVGEGDHVVAQGRKDPHDSDELIVARIGVVSE